MPYPTNKAFINLFGKQSYKSGLRKRRPDLYLFYQTK